MKIAVTGGIGSGKSGAASILASALRAHLFSADRICHELMRPDEAGWQGITDFWGDMFLNADRTLNRPLMRDQVFRDPGMRRKLEEILHPLIRREILARINAVENHGESSVVEIPLLYEVGWQDAFDAVVAVYAPEPISINRIITRDGLSRDEARRIVNSQMPPEEKASLATYVVDNSGLWVQTIQQVRRLARVLKKNFGKPGKPVDSARQGLTP